MKKTWIGMRFTSVILASLLAFGCGNGSGNDPHGFKTSTFSPPSITELVPNSVPVNSVPFAFTVNGTNFSTDAIVVWNGTPLSTTFLSSNQLVAVLAAIDLMNVGLIRVYVRTAGLNSNTVDFDVTGQ
ncbi:MAG TPA: IPT/TIG domain-containing protein [Pyrinomonadaceae bacterium]|nr:IPT/TIG domain-containing protein [Pyrinomonadaceae bacterium]